MRVLAFALAFIAALATLFTPAAMAMRGVHHPAPQHAVVAAMHHAGHSGHGDMANHHNRPKGQNQDTHHPRDMMVACAGCMAMTAQPLGAIVPCATADRPAETPDTILDDLRALPPLPPPRA